MPSSYVFVRSADRTMGTSSAFVVRLPQTYKSITSMSLVSAELSFAMYNIDTPFTSGCRFTHDGITFDMSLPGGFYAIDDLRSAMLASLQTAFPTAGVSAVNYAEIMGRLAIVYGSGRVFTVQNTSAGLLGRIFGTDPAGSATMASAGALSFPFICQLFPVSTLFLRISELPALCVATNSQTAFARIQLSAAPKSVVMSNNANGVVNTNNFSTPIATLSTLTCSLFSADGIPVNLHGCEWTFTLLVQSAA